MRPIIAPLLNNTKIDTRDDIKRRFNRKRYKCFFSLYIKYIKTGSLIKIENDDILIFPVKPLNSIDLVNKFPFNITDWKILEFMTYVSAINATTINIKKSFIKSIFDLKAM